MPKNKINLNTLPLGDMPDGGLIILPGDNITIRESVIIYETVENGKKVVKLYRQEQRPQQNRPAPASLRQPGRKRPGSPFPANPEKKSRKAAKRGRLQLTADQEIRRTNITEERKWVSAELKACAAEWETLLRLTGDPNYPDLVRRLELNRARKIEAETRAREVGVLRRQLNFEIFPDSKNNGYWGGQDVEEGMMGLEQPHYYFGQPSVQSYPTLFNEPNSDPHMYGRYDFNNPSIQDPYQQSFASVPGHQAGADPPVFHPPYFHQQHENQPTHSDANADIHSDNRIHPSRLSLMNSNTAMPNRYSTEPKVLMKATGENWVPLGRVRKDSRPNQQAVKQMREQTKVEEKHEYIPGDRDASVDSWEAPNRGHVQVKQESIATSTFSTLPDIASKSDQAVDWLNANIPLREDSTLTEMMQVQKHAGQDDADPTLVQEAHHDSIVVKLGLQRYRDTDATQDTRFDRGLSTGEAQAENTMVKQEPDLDHSQAQDLNGHTIIMKAPLTHDSTSSQENQGADVIILQEPDSDDQPSTGNSFQ